MVTPVRESLERFSPPPWYSDPKQRPILVSGRRSEGRRHGAQSRHQQSQNVGHSHTNLLTHPHAGPGCRTSNLGPLGSRWPHPHEQPENIIGHATLLQKQG